MALGYTEDFTCYESLSAPYTKLPVYMIQLPHTSISDANATAERYIGDILRGDLLGGGDVGELIDSFSIVGDLRAIVSHLCIVQPTTKSEANRLPPAQGGRVPAAEDDDQLFVNLHLHRRAFEKSPIIFNLTLQSQLQPHSSKILSTLVNRAVNILSIEPST